jgi:hypothetical protein
VFEGRPHRWEGGLLALEAGQQWSLILALVATVYLPMANSLYLSARREQGTLEFVLRGLGVVILVVVWILAIRSFVV